MRAFPLGDVTTVACWGEDRGAAQRGLCAMQGSQQRSRVMGQALLEWLRNSDGVRPEGALRSASWRKGWQWQQRLHVDSSPVPCAHQAPGRELA